jgi:hypothetical protein
LGGNKLQAIGMYYRAIVSTSKIVEMNMELAFDKIKKVASVEVDALSVWMALFIAGC